MILTTSHPYDIVVVRPGTSRLTAINAKEFKDAVVEVALDGASSIIVDFKEVSFLDSSGLGALVGVFKRIGNRGELAVCDLNSEVEQMFRICRMDRVFAIYPNAEAAVETISERM